MTLYIKLFIEFFKIGLFSFGGGYAMIPLIKERVIGNNLLGVEEFFNIIGVAAMAPGSIAVNSTVAIGFLYNGVLGTIVLVIAIILPSFILSLLLFKLMNKIKEHKLVEDIFYFLRPAVLAMIISAAVSIGKGVLFSYSSVNRFNIDISVMGLGIFLIALILSLKTKLHPVLLIIISGVLGGVLL